MGQNAPAWKLQYGVAQNVAYTATAGTSTAMPAQTYAAQLSATSSCHIRISQAGTAAVTTDTLLKATDPPLVLGLAPGDKVSVVQDSAAGTLNVSPLTH